MAENFAINLSLKNVNSKEKEEKKRNNFQTKIVEGDNQFLPVRELQQSCATFYIGNPLSNVGTKIKASHRQKYLI